MESHSESTHIQNYVNQPALYIICLDIFSEDFATEKDTSYLLSGIPEAVVVVFSRLPSATCFSTTKLDACEKLATSCTARRTPLIAHDCIIKGGLGGGQEHKAGQDTQQQ